MFGLIVSALRARRAQTVALFALTVLAAVGASAAPWFLGWAKDAVAEADIAAAPARQRLVIAAGAVRYDPGAPSPVGLLRDIVATELDLPGAVAQAGARLYVTVTRPGSVNGPEAGLYLGFRDDVCAQVRLIEGTCPSEPGDVLLGRSTAEALGLSIEDEVRFEGFRLATPAVLKVSGTYVVANPLDAYWAGADRTSGPTEATSAVVDEPAYVSERTLLDTGPNGLDLDLRLFLPPDVYHGADKELGGTLDRAATQLRQKNLEVRTEARDLVAQVDREQRLVTLGVLVAAVQLVLLCWFVLFLAVRHTADDRRPDIGLLKIRGAARWRIWSLTALQSALPMVAGTVSGWVLGFGAAVVLSGEVRGLISAADTTVRDTLVRSGLAAAAAGAGALFAAMLAEFRVLRSPVVALLRRVPGGRRGWRAEVGDLLVLVLAVVGVYQGYAELQANGEPSVLVLLAPGLIGLAVALLVARSLPWLAAHAGATALRAGHPGAGLTALHLARRRGTHRVLAVLAVCVAVFTTATFFWHTARTGWSDRAGQELGANEVLTVRAPNSTMLLRAVQTVDPDGAYAMAVARTDGVDTEDRLLAVDSPRLSTVANLASSDMDDAATLLRPPGKPIPAITDGTVTMDLEGPTEVVPGRGMKLRLHAMSSTGVLTIVEFGPLGPGRASYQAEMTHCPKLSCRLVALEPVPGVERATPAQSHVSIYDIRQADRAIIDAAALGDITRWSGQLGSVGLGNLLAAGADHLSITPRTEELRREQRRDYRVFALTTPVPLPIILAGDRPEARRPGDPRFTILGTDQLAYQVVARSSVLPRLGASGAVVDLDYASRATSRVSEAAVLEVWLNSAAPADIEQRLAAVGVQVLARHTTAELAGRLANQGPGTAMRFQLFAAGIVLLLAAGTVVVTATVERRSRVEELTALRVQGLSDRSMVMAGHGGTGVLVLGAIATGLFAAILAAAVVTASMPVFADTWTLLPLQRGTQPLPLALAAVVALVVIGAAAVAGSARVVASVRGRPGRPASDQVPPSDPPPPPDQAAASGTATIPGALS